MYVCILDTIQDWRLQGVAGAECLPWTPRFAKVSRPCVLKRCVAKRRRLDAQTPYPMSPKRFDA